MTADKPTVPSDVTVHAEEEDATRTHAPDREPTPEEAELAQRRPVDPKVAAAYDEANKRGANVKGEGQVES